MTTRGERPFRRHRLSTQTEHLRAESVIDEDHGDVGQPVTFGEEFEDRVDESDAEFTLGSSFNIVWKSHGS